MKLYLILLLIVFFAFDVSASLNVSLSDQGTNTTTISTGELLASGNLTVTIWDSLSGGNLIYNETFSNAIVNGDWNVMLGENSSNPLSLEYGKIYYRDYLINGNDMDFTNLSGGIIERQFFYSPLGDIADEDISDTTNLTLGQKITFAFGEVVDNIVDGWIGISGGLNVSGDAIINGVTYSSTGILFPSNFLLNDGTRNRFTIGNINTEIFSPDGTERIVLANGAVIVDSSSFAANDGTRNRLVVDSGLAELLSPDGYQEIELTNSYAKIKGGGIGRVYIDTTDSRLISPDGINIFKLNNTDATITNNLTVGGFYYGDGSQLTGISPGIWNNISGVATYDGNVNVSGNAIIGGLTYSSTGILFPSTFSLNDGTRNRFETDASKVRITAATGAGYFQITDDALLYEDGSKDRIDITSTYSTIHDEPTTGGGSLKLDSKELIFNDGVTNRIALGQVWASEYVYKDVAGNDRVLIEGDTSVIRDQMSGYIELTSNTFKVNDGTKNRISSTNTATNLFDEINSNGGHLELRSNALTFDDGTRDRIIVSASETKLVSPDGSKSVIVKDSDVIINGRSAKRMVAFTGGLPDTTVARRIPFGDEGTTGLGPVMPLNGTVVYMTISTRLDNTLTVTLLKNDVSTDNTISLSSAQTAVATANITFVAGDRINMFKEGDPVTASALVATFFVEFDD